MGVLLVIGLSCRTRLYVTTFDVSESAYLLLQPSSENAGDMFVLKSMNEFVNVKVPTFLVNILTKILHCYDTNLASNFKITELKSVLNISRA